MMTEQERQWLTDAQERQTWNKNCIVVLRNFWLFCAFVILAVKCETKKCCISSKLYWEKAYTDANFLDY